MKVALLVTCLVDLMRPPIGFAAIDLLEAAGCEVSVPEAQTCCGQSAYNAGDRKSAMVLARKVLEEFEDFDYVVIPSGSCAGMLRTHYADLFAGQAEEARIAKLCARTFELTDFLSRVMKGKGIQAQSDLSMNYHDSCSGLRDCGIKDQPRELLAKVKGVKVKEMEQAESCCGFGGLFSVKYSEIATHIAKRKCEFIAKAGVDAVVLGDLGGMLHIEGCLRRGGDDKTQVLHVAEVLSGKPKTSVLSA